MYEDLAARCMLFMDDIVLIWESKENLNEKWETWTWVLETHSFRLIRSKTEYMDVSLINGEAVLT